MPLWAATAEAAAVPATMNTILEVNPPATRYTRITEASITFSGVSATDVPVLIQFVEVTATSAAGTAVTPASVQDMIAGMTAGATSKKLPATEGTVVVIKTYNVPLSSGLVIQYPLGREPFITGAAATARGFAIRANRGSGAAINADCNIEWEE